MCPPWASRDEQHHPECEGKGKDQQGHDQGFVPMQEDGIIEQQQAIQDRVDQEPDRIDPEYQAIQECRMSQDERVDGQPFGKRNTCGQTGKGEREEQDIGDPEEFLVALQESSIVIAQLIAL